MKAGFFVNQNFKKHFHSNPVNVMVIKGNFTNFANARAVQTRYMVPAVNVQAYYPACSQL